MLPGIVQAKPFRVSLANQTLNLNVCQNAGKTRMT